MASTEVAQSQELTPAEFQARVDEAHRIQEEFINAMGRGREAMWDLSKWAYEFKEAQGWSALGYEKLTDWLAQPEISVTRATFYRLHQTYYDMVVKREIPEATMRQVDQSKVAVVLPQIKAGKVTVEDALSDAEVLGMQDLRDKYRAASVPTGGTSREGVEPGDSDDAAFDKIVPSADDIDGSAQPVAASDIQTPEGYWDEKPAEAEEPAADLPERFHKINWDDLEGAIVYANAALNMPLRNKHRAFDKETVAKLQQAVEQLVDALNGSE